MKLKMIRFDLILFIALAIVINSTYAMHLKANNSKHESWLAVRNQLNNVPRINIQWNQCDKKCVALQSSTPDVDFFVINFWTSRFSPRTAACYGKSKNGESQLWNYFVQNEQFQRLCGGDGKDFRKVGAYQIVEVQGSGFGTLINY